MDISGEHEVAIIILNYKTPKLVVDCLDSISKSANFKDFYVVVVDNNSGDSSVKEIAAAINKNNWGSWVELVAAKENGGFSYGNNLGISSINANYYLLLNSDTIIVEQAIYKLYEFANMNSSASIVSPRLIWPDGELQTNGFRDIHPLSELVRAAKIGIISKLLKRYLIPVEPCLEVTHPDWVCFACVLIKKEVLDIVGCLDENYFMYYEDVDYCRRAKQAGFEIATCPDAKVIHLNGGSSGINNKKRSLSSLPDYYYRSRMRYFREHYGQWGLFFANILWSIGRAICFVRQSIFRRPIDTQNDAFLKIWGF